MEVDIGGQWSLDVLGSVSHISLGYKVIITTNIVPKRYAAATWGGS